MPKIKVTNKSGKSKVVTQSKAEAQKVITAGKSKAAARKDLAGAENVKVEGKAGTRAQVTAAQSAAENDIKEAGWNKPKGKSTTKTIAELAEIQAQKDAEAKEAKKPKYQGAPSANSRDTLALRLNAKTFEGSNNPRTQERARKNVGMLLTSGIHASEPTDRLPCMTPGCKNTTGWDDSVTCKDCDSQGKF
jgi:hypothetical protein